MTHPDTLLLRLRKTRKALTDPNRWMQDLYYRNSPQNDGHVRRLSLESDCFCICGAYAAALLNTTPRDQQPETGAILTTSDEEIDAFIFEHAPEVIGEYPNVRLWNDDVERTHDEVLALLDDLIARAETLAQTAQPN